MKVLKFGGSSVASEDSLKKIAGYLATRSHSEKMLVVVSARGKMTDSLIDEAYRFSKSPNKRELDRLLSTGEQQTIALLSITLCNLGIKTRSLTARQAGISASGNHTKGKIVKIDTSKIKDVLLDYNLAIVAGFQGINEKGDVTTLGRGGSDTSAVALAASLGCDCEIYTDVAGIYGIDPRICPNAKKIDRISYQEMIEMASLGAKVMEPRSIEIASKYGICIYVAKTLSKERGTWIMPAEQMIEQKVISGINLNDKIINVTLKNLPCEIDTIANIFEVMAHYQVNVDMISQITYGDVLDLMFTTSQDERLLLNDAIDHLKKRFDYHEILLSEAVSKVSIVGIGMRDASGVAGKVFATLRDLSVHFYQTTTSDISISITLDKQHGNRVVIALAEQFGL